MTNIAISIDWDFFFEEKLDYDWGHREAPFFIEALWHTRALGHRELLTEYIARDVISFWPMLKSKRLMPTVLYGSESHLFAYQLYLSIGRPDVLINFDAHPDVNTLGMKYIDCGNWASELLSRKRKLSIIWVRPETVDIDWHQTSVKATEQFKDRFVCMTRREFEDTYQTPARANIVISYICRSGAWTPPWEDDKFDAFIKSSNATMLWHDDKQISPRKDCVPTERQFEEYKKQMAEYREQYQKEREKEAKQK